MDHLGLAEPSYRTGEGVERVLRLLKRRGYWLALIKQLGMPPLRRSALDKARDHLSVELHVVRTAGELHETTGYGSSSGRVEVDVDDV